MNVDRPGGHLCVTLNVMLPFEIWVAYMTLIMYFIMQPTGCIETTPHLHLPIAPRHTHTHNVSAAMDTERVQVQPLAGLSMVTWSLPKERERESGFTPTQI